MTNVFATRRKRVLRCAQDDKFRGIQGLGDELFFEVELFGGGVAGGVEVGSATGFVEAGGAYDDEFLRLPEALGVDRGLAADHADGGELGDLVGECHQVRDGAEGFVGEGGVEAGDEDSLAHRDQFHRQRNDLGGEELDLVDADDLDGFELRKEQRAEVLDRSDGSCLVGLCAVAGDGGPVVAEVDVRLVAGDALAGDAGALEAADELFALAREHGAGDDFEDAGGWRCGVHGWVDRKWVGAVDKWWDCVKWGRFGFQMPDSRCQSGMYSGGTTQEAVRCDLDGWLFVAWL
jgi:hypothetical protein